MSRGDHGEDSKYIHVRLRSPKIFSRMRTVDVGSGVKQVTGRIKKKKQWTAQNVMIPVDKVKKRGSKITVPSKKLKKHLKGLGINISKVERIKTRGVNDYKHPVPKRNKK